MKGATKKVPAVPATSKTTGNVGEEYGPMDDIDDYGEIIGHDGPDDNESAGADTLVSSSLWDLEQKGPMRIVLPYETLRYVDNCGFTYVRVRLHLLSGATTTSTSVSVHPSGMYLVVKYQAPRVWTAYETVDQISDEGLWIANGLSLKYEFGKHLDKVNDKYDGQSVYYVQYIKLPVRCDLQLSNDAGTKAFVQLYEHEDEDFRKNHQFIAIYHVNLIGAEKPREERSTVTFTVSKNPTVSEHVPMSPFALTSSDTDV
jgi:hypothetical protein